MRFSVVFFELYLDDKGKKALYPLKSTQDTIKELFELMFL